MSKYVGLLLLWLLLAPSFAAAGEVYEAAPGEPVERHLPSDEPLTQWSQDPALLETELGDRLEQREVVADDVETVKLTNVMPPIRFESGVADIPASYIERLRGVLNSMRHLRNVRLHLVGHADDQPLSESLAGIYGDNAGLSRERAGEVAEFIQAALGLPPESISFEWAGDTQPIASNDTPEGRALNRRVEVEVWYDEVKKKRAVEEVVVPEEFKRIKVCRMETVCKLRYREGHARRARVKNLIAPLHFGVDTVGVPPAFVEQVAQALSNLRDKQNVTVKFVGFTDDVPLTGRAERIYGTHLAMSKAQARRVALAVKDALHLPSAAVVSDGRGAALPVASNETERGRALNRRVEVEFWHDDPLQELPDEPQPCPDAAAAEVVTKVYDPPWGRFEAVAIEDGQPVIPPDLEDELRRAMADVSGKTNVRLRFVGYTRNERLDRRTALVYGDDIGLSAARARRTMEKVKEDLGLSDSQVEHEGRGYVQSNDVVNAGFIEGETSHVVAEVVYDELAVLDDYEGVDVTPITRELTPRDPLALNLMRISVDGEPIDDPGRSSADVQRCTDVALDRADIAFHFDDLEADRRLSVTSEIREGDGESGESGSGPIVLFRTYTNYAPFIERSEVRIFHRTESLQAAPLEVAEVGENGLAVWIPGAEEFATPVRQLKFVLRAYGAEGQFDETAPQSLWLSRRSAGNAASTVASGGPGGDASASQQSEEHPERTLFRGYGESDLAIRNIPLGSVGTIRVDGRGVPPEHTVWLAGQPVPVDEQGNFVAEAILPSGMHTVEVAVLDEEGNGELFLRDLELKRDDWFYVGIADLTVGWNTTSGPADELQGKDAPYDYDSLADGRLAFYLSGKFGDDWKLTASADTREGPVEDLFTNFLDKSPDSLFRRLDPDYHYPTFGDDSTVEENAPTNGKFYVKLNKGESHALWGNFDVGYVDNELALVERGLYGANLHYQSESTTRFGEQRFEVDGFAAEPGTVSSREEFRGTGGSLYYLRRQDLLMGSDRVRIEVRDKDSGLVSAVVYLKPGVDYDVDYLQGRILLSEPVTSTVADELLVRSGGLSGDEAWLVVQYEYTPGFGELDGVTTGGQAHYWINDFVRVGATASYDDEGDSSTLYAGDVTVRKSAGSWFKFQAGRSDGPVSTSLRSDDGGFSFRGTPTGLVDAEAGAYRADVSVAVGDFFEGGRGVMTLYGQWLDAGYSAPGLITVTDTLQYGGTLRMPVTDSISVTAKSDSQTQKDGLETSIQEVDLSYQLTDSWTVSTGVRYDDRQDDSPLVPVTQEEGSRTDGVLQVAYDSKARWRSYGFAQATLVKTGDRERNGRYGVGGSYRISDRLLLDGEVSYGDLGPGVKVGSTYEVSDETSMYVSYSLGDEQAIDGVHSRRGNLIYGTRTRMSDSTSVYMENRYQHSDATNGLTRAMGMNLAPDDRWTLGADWETGELYDRQTNAETKRRAGGIRVGYAFDTLRLSSAIEYRYDETEQLDGTWSDRTTWLFRNNFGYQVSPDWRLLGKFNHSFSDSSLGDFYDGGYTEGVLGFAYRPVSYDRLNVLAKYTYFYNVPSPDQVVLENTPVEYIQKSHIASIDVSFDVLPSWTVGAKYAYRLGQVSLDREDPDFFDNSAHLVILRNDLRVFRDWEGSVEGRMLDLPDIDERRIGALLAIYRYLGDHFKVGIGYNFTDFSDDLTDLSYDHQGVFLNLIGTL